jgi:hypothetical protein
MVFCMTLFHMLFVFNRHPSCSSDQALKLYMKFIERFRRVCLHQLWISAPSVKPKQRIELLEAQYNYEQTLAQLLTLDVFMYPSIDGLVISTSTQYIEVWFRFRAGSALNNHLVETIADFLDAANKTPSVGFAFQPVLVSLSRFQSLWCWVLVPLWKQAKPQLCLPASLNT